MRIGGRRRLTLDGLVIRLGLATSPDVCTLYLVFKEPRFQRPHLLAVWRPHRGCYSRVTHQGQTFEFTLGSPSVSTSFFVRPQLPEPGAMRLAIKGLSEKLTLQRGP